MRQRRNMLIVLELVAICLALMILIPFLMILVNSFKDIRESALFGLSLPREWHFSNYKEIFVQAHIVRGFMNSFLISGCVVLSVNVFASMAAFIIQRRDDRFLRTAYYLFIMGLIVPVSIVPTIKLMGDLHIRGTYFSLIMYYTAVLLPFAVFLLVGFMKSIPRELDEAALLEGCGYFRLYVQIILPLIITVLVTVAIVVMVSVWNDFFGPFYLMTDSTKWTIVLQIFNFVTMYSTNWGVVFAFMVVVVAPILLIYLFLQRYIIDGLTAGSLKG
ncbi:raffinose/stachyose/melibiose transport system permease protein [Paenibacillus sp. V4I9]|uniref:carbohydrate ABC transporter permease n=1 Tax=Paenibacillus sp. V4I9 TaxID=3042308 RepID=UPI002784065A|nr:carbohydrate ABC transporter permease [Paenibacillus sp. V4I9]MDQ0889030.1 raffinose/stachyose/melibiose transport system permease protein [Paenibacillus sp. V4I9]